MNVDPRHQQYLLALCVFLGALFVVLPLFSPWRSVYIDCDEDGVIGGPEWLLFARSLGGAPGPSGLACSGECP